ncbi:FtsK/SpoIIIE family DNA translocase [Paenibacillus lentus]|uniref:DNA translocase FtsK n=1 Tax=Paenibacillus lentus TaxID=1338368 RepID=A0A3Q8SCW0_9BACL|nr:DNA translocase FtsK [Paenibacillus lentus]AZK47734.1 DNA translocase FtsK [Paenibacillus lentus]
MARKKKKKKAALGTMLKYEIYGIILITLSIIALSGEAAVGRTLSKMSALVLGKFYFVIPLIGIFIGLSVMINRKWPARWNTRRSGALLAVLSLVLMSTTLAMEKKLAPSVSLSAGSIMSQIHHDLQTALFEPTLGETGFSLLGLDISGGYVGGLEFALLYSLFGIAGAKLIMIVMMAISFMLITGLSYVELFRLIRKHLGGVGTKFSRKLKLLRPVPVHSKSKRPAAEPVQDAGYEEQEQEEEELSLPAQPRNRPVFFQLFNFKPRPKPVEPAGDVHEDLGEQINDYRDPYSSDVDWNALKYGDSHSRSTAARFDPLTGEPLVQQEEQGEVGPIIRDFFDNIHLEGRPTDAEREGEEQAEEQPLWPKEAETESAPEVILLSEDLDLPEAETMVEGALIDDSSIEDPSGESVEGITGAEDKLEGADPPPKPAPKPYKLPPFRLLSKPAGSGKAGDQADYKQTARKLEATLESFGVRARVLEVVRGPAVTRYEIQPDIGVKVSRIVNLTDDIALALAARDIRMEAPIPGKSAIGIEVPNNEVSLVTMREVMETPVFQDADSKLSIAFGRDISGQTIVGNLAKMPHLLVAGATGSGKSVCINGIITSILYKAKPDEVKFLMVDPKMVELNVYNGIPHLLAPVVTDPKRASLALKKIVVEMEKRYELFSKSGARNVEGYNLMMKDNPEAVLPYIVVIVDELADLMMVAANDVEDAIARLAQMARAAGIHLIIATQRPSVDVITGVIKANIPSRIAFGVSSQVDSRTILDMAGAEKLLGRGDMLFMPMGASKPIRVQGAFMSDQEVEAIVGYVRGQAQAEYDESLVPEVDEEVQETEEVVDELFDQAVQIILEAKQASVSLLQRRMRIGYTRAARLIDSMEARGIVGPYEGSKPREVLISMEQFKLGKISS